MAAPCSHSRVFKDSVGLVSLRGDRKVCNGLSMPVSTAYSVFEATTRRVEAIRRVSVFSDDISSRENKLRGDGRKMGDMKR